MPDKYPTCVNCGGRIQKINFALGPEWRHWPTPHGNYRTNELYRYCRTAALVATPKPEGRDHAQSNGSSSSASGEPRPIIRYSTGSTSARLSST